MPSSLVPANCLFTYVMSIVREGEEIEVGWLGPQGRQESGAGKHGKHTGDVI